MGTESTVKQKRGVRGKIQKNAIEGKAEYITNALQIAVGYTYMSKGQLLDFFEKGSVTEKENEIEVTAANVFMKGDKLTILLDKKTNLFINKKFSSFLGEDLFDGEIKYLKFSSGINHVSETTLNLPAEKALINALNEDYTQRIN